MIDDDDLNGGVKVRGGGGEERGDGGLGGEVRLGDEELRGRS